MRGHLQWLIRVSLLVISLVAPTLLLPPPGTTKSDCSLYEDAVGMACFHGDEVTLAVTDSDTSWWVEFYSSWCGHCQHFAPTWRAFAAETVGWSGIVRVGVMDCSVQENSKTCASFSVKAYPSIKMFHPSVSDPQEEKNHDQYRGSRTFGELVKGLVNHVESAQPRPLHWPDLQPLVSDKLLGLPPAAWSPTVLVFEAEGSYLGKELILDFFDTKGVVINRVLKDNLALVKHYSILEFPSVVIEVNKEHYRIVAGNEFQDPRKEFRRLIAGHLAGVGLTGGQRREKEGAREGGGNARGTARKVVVARQSRTVTNRVNSTDILSAISYALRREVPLHNIISGSAFTSLLRFVHLLESAFRVAYPAVSLNLWPLRTKLELRQKAGFILSRDWTRLVETKLDPVLFPKEPRWANCLGSQPHFRGYPCGLWSLMHTVTVLTLPVKSRISHVPAKLWTSSKDALYILSHFVKTFFSCEYCQEHFTKMAQSLSEGVVLYNGDAVLWLWAAHNIVNRRLSGDVSSDPLYPKGMFPPQHTCPYCYVHRSRLDTSGPNRPQAVVPTWNNTGFLPRQSLVEAKRNDVSEYTWNRTAVLLYLWNFYHLDHSGVTTISDVLHAAWPKKAVSNDPLRFYGRGGGGRLEMNSYDVCLWLVCYAMCALFLVLAAFWLMRKRKLRLSLFP